MNEKRGLFISFEGVEGSGKTTQIDLLAKYFSNQNKVVIKTKEPGGTSVGKTIRKILLDKNIILKSNYSEILFFTADRLEHIEQLIKPALLDGKIVITDRYIDSTLAYQAGGRKISSKIIDFLINLVDLKPDITFLLDLDPEIGLSRVRNRNPIDPDDTIYKDNRFEQEVIQFHHNVRQSYLSLAKHNSTRIKLISVHNRSPQSIHQEIISYLSD